MLAALRCLGTALTIGLAALSVQAEPINLVSNGDFETRNFSGWNPIGNSDFNAVACAPQYAFSGNCGAYFGAVFESSGISQTLTGLSVGAHYTISFELNVDGGTPSIANASFGATTLLALSDPPSTSPAFKKYEFEVTAASVSEVLAFSFRDDPGGIVLDAVSVTAVPTTVPEPASLALAGLALVGIAATRRRKQ